ncbi:NAD(P)/FAD-dependent oxidoreductase [Gloeocapsopsis crepidinum LEGE 06123]|uniref:NAD(P)/FAD-dependent oxidoreductase n=1 Tax=Gloeocapsopsis crepidinum LEGE 06123 TaxID=588587 RepID=A0ABR9UP23_9CHRO|nr:NAD(P)/FAD-dependent oxidoreductase [Gloeocapsopsis crepidinum]MBE9189763.1 NAD(P)/FAD-dependent oxidoreductase [Gloeocapsopsis crepidinum LEGE 06123]
MSNSTADPTIVILGGGFTGLFTALHLSHHNNSQPIILIDRSDRFTFNPLLYEFLSGEMHETQVYPRYEELLQGKNITFIQDTVQAIDLRDRRVQLASDTHYCYSYLVLALGCVASYFGIEGAKENCLCFRNGQDAIQLAQQLRDRLQQAIETEDASQRQKLLTVAIVGGGPSGVELAATLADLLPNWYAELGGNAQEVSIVLIDREPKLLAGGAKGGFKSELHDTAQAALGQRNVPVELLLGATVTAVRPEQVEFQRNDQTETLAATTVIWTAGTTTNPLIQQLPISEANRDRHGRLHVTSTLQLIEYPEVFAGGDCAANIEHPMPPTAQVAYQQGATIAKNLRALTQGEQLVPGEVNLRGILLKLGLGESAASIFNHLEVTGKAGHAIRQATYLSLLPTPVHNFQAATQWLVDEIFDRHCQPANLAGTASKE